MSDKAGLSSQGNHARLYTYSLALGTVEIVSTPGWSKFSSSPTSFIECQEPGELFIVDIRVNVHLPCVDLHNTRSGLFSGGGELDLSVQPGQGID